MIDNFENKKKKVAVIGAGPSGIVSAKTAIECGFEVVLFEKNDNIGGVWSIGESGKAWENMKTHISYVSMSYSDFGWDVSNERKPFHPTKEEMFKYLYDYSKHFKVLENTRLNTTIISISQINNNNINHSNNNTNNNQWLIISKKINEKLEWEAVEEIYDFVIICTGMYNKKRDIDINDKLKKKFNGRVWSSGEFKNPEPFINKNVLVVGGFSSAIEIASAIAEKTKMVYLNCRNKIYVLKRRFPLDGDNIPVADYCFQKRSMVYEGEKKSKEEINKMNDHFFNLASENQRENSLFKYNKPENETHYHIFSDNFLKMLQQEKIKLIENSLIDCNGNEMRFKDSNGNIETIDNVDEIINCVGYDVDLPFFDHKIKKIISLNLTTPHLPIVLYKHTLSPNLENIAFIGMYRTPSLAEMELQARFAIYGFAGITQLPTKETMLEDIKIIEKVRNLNEKHNRPQFVLESSLLFCDDLAKQIGALPDFNKLKENDPQIYNIIWNNLFHPSFYRIIGPFSNSNSKNILLNDYNNYFIKKNN
ncbi:hypothetical protein ACTFIV_008533 [Dictyostelium citrinum]